MSARSNSKNESGGYMMVPLREEFAALAEDLPGIANKGVFALVLGQMEYWQGKKELDEYVAEEQARAERGGAGATAFGWFWKSGRQLSKELQGGWSHVTLSRVLKKLHELGIVHRRRNPRNKGDNILHYRMDMVRLGRLLLAEVLLEEGSADRAANSITRAPAGSLRVLGGSRGSEQAARNRVDDPDLPDCENDSIDPGPSRCVDDYPDLASCLLGVGRGGGLEPGDDDDGFDMDEPGLMPWDVICDTHAVDRDEFEIDDDEFDMEDDEIKVDDDPGARVAEPPSPRRPGPSV